MPDTPSRNGGRSLTRLSAAGALLAAFFMLHALWVPAKGALGQALLERSWRQALAGHPGQPPWPWADTSAAALLEVPRLGIRQVVLAGMSNRNLAWGPVMHVLAGGPHNGDLLLSGHRDTHFRFLERLQTGDALRLNTGKRIIAYQVRSIDVVDSTRAELVARPGLTRLTLVTCFPFDAPRAGGPLRYVVTAMPVAVGDA